jgi:hypothetical protein
MKTLSTFVIAIALIAVMVGCAPAPSPIQYTLTISSTEGGSVTDPGEGTFVYDEGTVVNLVEVEAEQGYQFANWTGDVGTIANVNAGRTTITMNGDYSITANFVRVYSLAVSSTARGSVTAPGEGAFPYRAGSVVNLVATADSGYHFVSWTGDVITVANVSSAMTSITMNSGCTITANFAIDLRFWAEACVALNGPASLPPEQRNACVMLQVMTNMVIASVRVALPDGRSVLLSAFTDVFTPDVDWTTLFRFAACEPGMPIAGGEYVFTAFDAVVEPIPGVGSTDIWVGVDPPDPPTNVRAEVTEDGILVSWDEVPTIPDSFEPGAQPQLGDYRLEIFAVETGETIYGAFGISVSSHLVPRDRANFIEGRDWGLSISEMEDGTYYVRTRVASMAPAGSLGKGLEYFNTDPGQDIVFTVEDGRITLS